MVVSGHITAVHAVPWCRYDPSTLWYVALIAGDLWSGNFGSCGSVPIIYDPATYLGHSEAEFGMVRKGITPGYRLLFYLLAPS